MTRIAFLAFWLVAMVLTPFAAAQGAWEDEPTVQLTFADSRELIGVVASNVSGKVVAQAAETTRESLGEKTQYTFAAEEGDGITHLARKTVHQYLNDSDESGDYNRAARVYLEDYLQNRIGTYGLAIDEAVTITVNQLEEALQAVGEFDQTTLSASLAQFVGQVNWDRYESLAFAGEVADSGDNESDQDDSEATNGDQSGATDDEAAKTEAEQNDSRTRTVTYIIIVVVILIVAGYLLFKGTREQSGSHLTDKSPKQNNSPPKKTNGRK